MDSARFEETMFVSACYAALLSLGYIFLSARVIRGRRIYRVALGVGSSADLEKRIAAHANFSEYVPITLLLLFFVESSGASVYLINLLGITLLVGRMIHAYGVSQAEEDFRFRVSGMALTLSVLGVSAAYLLARALMEML